VFQLVATIAAGVAMVGMYVGYGIAAVLEARDSDVSAKRWSRRRRRARKLRAADDEARRAVEDALARAQVVRDRDPR
jgi:hypothetical protein